MSVEDFTAGVARWRIHENQCMRHPRSMIKFTLGVALVVLAYSNSSMPAAEITRDEARQLVLGVLQAQGSPVNSSKFDLEDNDGAVKYFPGFYFFDAYFDTPARLETVGSYAVNRKSADVWGWIPCKRLRPKAIQALQQSLRRQAGLSQKEYRELSRIAPCNRK